MKHLSRTLLCVLMAFVMMIGSASVVYAADLPADGVYEGSANGMGGALTVSVTVEGGKITDIAIVSHSETAGISDPAIEKIPAAIVEAQSTDVDAVSGATVTSGAIAAAVEAALSASVEEKASEIIPSFEKADVLVIGSGMSGLCASVRAAQLGANVLVLEQTGIVGGCARYSGGSLVGVNTIQQAEQGIEDSPELLIEDFKRLGGEENFNMDLAVRFADFCGTAVDWLDEYVGVEFTRELTNGGYIALNVPRVHYSIPEDGNVANASGSGASGYVKALSAKQQEFVEAGNLCLLLNTRATDVLQDENGAIIGVKADTPYGERTYAASTVILATGGYGGNAEWLHRDCDNVLSTSPACVTGDGFTFAEKLGAGFAGMDWNSFSIGAIPNGTMYRTFQINAFSWFYPLWVTVDGDRFINEPASNSATRSDAAKEVPQNIIWLVFNDAMLAETDMLFYLSPDDDATTLQKILDAGEVAFKCDTIEELTSAANLANLPATVEAYNKACAGEAEDAMGRTDNMTALAEGPFYAVQTIPYISLTKGGPLMSVNAELLREDGTVIPGVYLCGEIVGSNNISGHCNVGGMGHGNCVTWGMIAAESALAFIGK